MANIKDFLIRLIFTLFVIGISLKQIHETNTLVKSAQDNISKAKYFLYTLKINNLGYLYQLAPRLILIMNYSLLIAAILFLLKIDGYMLLVNNFIIIQYLFINNIFLDNSSKCYLIASAYLSLYGSFYYFK